jgi:hypothetical protein
MSVLPGATRARSPRGTSKPRPSSWVCVAVTVVAVMGTGLSTSESGAMPAKRQATPLAHVQAPDAPTIPFKPVALRGRYVLQVLVPVVVPRALIGLVYRQQFSCTGRMAGFPEARIHASGIPWQRARKGSISGSKYGKNLSPAVKQRWSAFEAQPDSIIAPCVVEW